MRVRHDRFVIQENFMRAASLLRWPLPDQSFAIFTRLSALWGHGDNFHDIAARYLFGSM
jgi:hypothetical protein